MRIMSDPNLPPQPQAPQNPYESWNAAAQPQPGQYQQGQYQQAQQAPYGTPQYQQGQYQQTQQAPYGTPQYQQGQYQQGGVPPQYGQAPYYTQKSKIIAGLLGIFFGSIGIHNFYLGKTTRGIVQIIATLMTLGLAGLWGFLEGILILVSQYGSPWHQDANGVELIDTLS